MAAPLETTGSSWQDSIHRQREELARMLHEPLALLARKCVPAWGERETLNGLLLDGYSSIPYCTYLYALSTDGMQSNDNIGATGIVEGRFGRDRALRSDPARRIEAICPLADRGGWRH